MRFKEGFGYLILQYDDIEKNSILALELHHLYFKF